MVEILSVDQFVHRDRAAHTVLDVRSPSEYAQGHIPGALNMPLFSDAERASIGTTYKRSGQQAAIDQGLHFVGPRMSDMLGRARELGGNHPLILHCWRGGKRSGSVAWLLDFAGMRTSVIQGGYKAYRAFQRQMLQSIPWKFIVLGGKTGSGKTDILHALRAKGEQVLDLEGLARHKGSAFGWIGESEQPSNEHFENLVGNALLSMQPDRSIWIENESRSVGKVFVPDPVWSAMLEAPLIHLEVPLTVRVQNLVETYVDGQNTEALIASFRKIEKRLGGQHLKRAVDSIEKGDYTAAAGIALTYYDKTYAYGLEKRRESHVLKLDTTSLPKNALIDALIFHARQFNPETRITDALSTHSV